MSKKYELCQEHYVYIEDDNLIKRKLYRIKALENFSNVKKDELGGFVESEANLSHFGNCWVYDRAAVYDNATISNNATIHDEVIVFENATIDSDAAIYDYAKIHGNATVTDCTNIVGFVDVCGHASILGNSEIVGSKSVSNSIIIDGYSKINGDITYDDDYLQYRYTDVCVELINDELRHYPVIKENKVNEEDDVEIEDINKYLLDMIGSIKTSIDYSKDKLDKLLSVTLKNIGLKIVNNPILTVSEFSEEPENSDYNVVVLKRKAGEGRIRSLFYKMVDLIKYLDNDTVIIYNIIESTFSDMLNRLFTTHIMNQYDKLVVHQNIQLSDYDSYFQSYYCNMTKILFIESTTEDQLDELLKFSEKYNIKIYTSIQLPENS